MRNLTAKLACLCLFLPGLSSARAASDTTPDQPDAALKQLRELALSTSLVRSGLRPWHMVMNFQLYDLKGKQQETGTIEEWWTSPETHRFVVTNPSLHLTGSTTVLASDNSAINAREDFLVNQLLQQTLTPVHRFPPFMQLVVQQQNRTFGKVHLNCLSVSPQNEKEQRGPLADQYTYCVAPNSYTLRTYSSASGALTVLRNQTATFQNTQLALNNILSYNGIVTIAGTIVKLEGYTPPPASAASPAGASKPGEKSVVAVRGGIIAGRRIGGKPPEYPFSSRNLHRSGSVLLHAIITGQGKIGSLVVIASPDSDLTGAAMDAVKTWTYMPYLLNGKPTSVDTTITVNFNLAPDMD